MICRSPGQIAGRASIAQSSHRVLRFGRFALDLRRGCLRAGEQEIDLSPKAFKVLCHLAENAGRLVPKQELYDAVWPNVIVSDDSLVQCIGDLRQKLGDDEHRLIKTVSRRGYLMDVPVSAGDVPTARPSQATTTSAERSSVLPLPQKPSIAVLPFANMSGDSQQEYFSDGITEDIITALSRLRWFFVIARNSTFVYKGQAADVRKVGRDLGVRYILEGSVRRSGQRVRVTGQLLDAMTGNHIWSERYDRELTDIFALQDEITARVAAAIEPKLLSAEGMRTETRSIDDLGAWELVARALSHFWKLTAAGSENAITILRQAVDRHPDYAPAHSMLAFALLVSVHEGWVTGAVDRQYAADLAHRAAGLDDNDPWAHMALGYLAIVERETTQALYHFQAVLDLNPSFAAAHGYVGRTLVLCGRSEESLPHFELATRMSPRDPWNGFFFSGLSGAHYMAGRYLQAVTYARQAVQLRPGALGGHRILCASLAQAGQIEEARSAMITLRKFHPDISVTWIRQSVPYTAAPMEHFLEGLRKAGLPE
jgi:TolB-like protein